MAVKIKLARNGICRDGYVGFSYTASIFNFFVPLFRGDFIYALIFLLAYVISIGLAIFTLGFLSIVSLLVSIYIGYIYNKKYTMNLLAQGYVPIDEFSYAMLYINGYIYKKIDGIDYEKYKFQFDSMEKGKKIMYWVTIALNIILQIIGIILSVLGIGILGFGLSNGLFFNEEIPEVQANSSIVTSESLNSSYDSNKDNNTDSYSRNSVDDIVNSIKNPNFVMKNFWGEFEGLIPTNGFDYTDYENEYSAFHSMDSRISIKYYKPEYVETTMRDLYDIILSDAKNRSDSKIYNVLREKKHFFVISYLENGIFYYNKTVFDSTNSKYMTMIMTYPKDLPNVTDELLKNMGNSLKYIGY